MPQRANNHAAPNGIKGFGTLDESKIIVTCDGIAVLPIKLVSYGEMEITADDYKLCKKYGRSSLTLVEKSAECACYVVKTTDAFAVVTKFDKRYFCKWAMSSFDIVKKVKEHNGVVYVYIKVHDETGDQTIRVPRTAFAEGKTSTLTQYNIAVHKNPGAELAMTVYFTRLLDEMQMEDAAQVIGVVKDKNTKDYIFNGYTKESEFKTANQYGNYQGYLEHFNPLLEQSAPLQYLLSATMAAPIMTVLQQKYNKDVHSYIINAVGASSTGKTISSRVCASAWTNPKDTVIFSAMHSTGNAALKKLAGHYGVPMLAVLSRQNTHTQSMRA